MKSKRKIIIIGMLLIMVICMVSIGIYYWYNSTYFVSTEDAKVDGDLYKISSQVSGKLLEFDGEEGTMVDKEQIVGQQELAGQPDSNLDTYVLRAPIKGTIIKKTVNVGEIITAGQVLAYVVDPDKVYITANIEETKLTKLREGEKVDVSIDKYKDKKFTGVVQSIGEASASEFSLLPTSTSANFTKVVQKVTVKIKLNSYGKVKLLPGINAVVRIHVK
ncbi:HlyD family secretion protein [Clostridium scatologenes]|uniref:EmrA-related transporter protein n=1 Tax=Clostridium scatologenes TaxID=1548 RepID=A0A0E3M9H8_CLOSL|nr:HlyD family efflux transporter periplasmic adaptor subunit [Clostridium scatologenes]AKA69528.1 EmrA-related transporter protein [Clostridium scatologenes]